MDGSLETLGEPGCGRETDPPRGMTVKQWDELSGVDEVEGDNDLKLFSDDLDLDFAPSTRIEADGSGLGLRLF